MDTPKKKPKTISATDQEWKEMKKQALNYKKRFQLPEKGAISRFILARTINRKGARLESGEEAPMPKDLEKKLNALTAGMSACLKLQEDVFKDHYGEEAGLEKFNKIVSDESEETGVNIQQTFKLRRPKKKS